MEVLAINRRARAIQVGRHVGLRPEQTRLVNAQQNATRKENEIVRLPIDPTYWQPLQTPDGTPFFMIDYDPIDSGFPLR